MATSFPPKNVICDQAFYCGGGNNLNWWTSVPIVTSSSKHATSKMRKTGFKKYGYSRFSHKEMSKSAHILLMTDLCILVLVFFTTKYGCNQSSDVWYIGFVLFFFKLTDGVVFTYHSSDSELNPDVIFKISPWVEYTYIKRVAHRGSKIW